MRLHAIRKDFGSFTALKDVALDIAQGEFVCFLGPSGCGKTTLLRIIAGLEPQTAGRIELAGRDISRLPAAERDYGIVFQSYALFPNLTVADNVAYGLVNRKVPKAQARSRVTELLAMARALATKPGLLLLDEPLSALDAIVRVKLRGEIRSLQRKLGVTTIMVTHDQEEAFAVADRIVVMNHGGIEQVGTAMQVYRDPATLFVADFVGRINTLPATAVEGGLRVGSQLLHCDHASVHRHAAGRELRVHLRPEDVLARPIAPDDVNVFVGLIEKIDFMGPYCLVRVRADSLGGERLTAYLSLNLVAEAGLHEGASLPLRLLPERMRVYS